MNIELLDEDVCTEPMPDGVRVYLSHFGGNPVATCDRCGWTCVYWECGCELVHDCGES